MPMAIPLLGAAFAMNAGIAMVGAAAIGTAASVIGGMMVIGGAATAFGTLTKDKDLVRFGSILGLAGGIANWATAAEGAAASSAFDGAGSAEMSDAAQLNKYGGTFKTGAEAAAAETAGQGALAPDAAAAPQTVVQDAMNAPPPAAATAAESPFKSLVDNSPMWGDNTTGVGSGGLIESAGTPLPDPTAGAAQAAQSAGAPAPGPTPTAQPAPTTAPTAQAGAGGQAGAGAFKPGWTQPSVAKTITQQSADNFWGSLAEGVKGIPDALKGNKELAYLGGGLISGAANSHTAQQTQRTAEKYKQARRDAYNASLSGLRMPTYRAPQPAPGG